MTGKTMKKSGSFLLWTTEKRRARQAQVARFLCAMGGNYASMAQGRGLE